MTSLDSAETVDGASIPPYQLPASFFSDPFDDDGPATVALTGGAAERRRRRRQAAGSIDLGSELGGDAADIGDPAWDEDVGALELDEPVALGPEQVKLVADELLPASASGRVVSLLENLQVDETETRSRAFAGADISAPSVWIRIKQALVRPKREQTATPAPARSASPVESDTPFGRLLTPLASSTSTLAHLEREISSDDVVFEQILRQRHKAIRDQGSALLFAIVTMLLIVIAERGYLNGSLIKAHQPTWLAAHLRAGYSGGLLFAIGLIVPVFIIPVLADIYTFTKRTFLAKTVFDAGIAVGAFSAAAAVIDLLVHGYPLQAAVVLTGWFALRAASFKVEGRTA